MKNLASGAMSVRIFKSLDHATGGQPVRKEDWKDSASLIILKAMEDGAEALSVCRDCEDLKSLISEVIECAKEDDSPEVKACVSKKIPILMEEGMEQKQAVAVAFSMCRKDPGVAEKGKEVPQKHHAAGSVRYLSYDDLAAFGRERLKNMTRPPVPVLKDGTSEGAKLGWETRKRDGEGGDGLDEDEKKIKDALQPAHLRLLGQIGKKPGMLLHPDDWSAMQLVSQYGGALINGSPKAGWRLSALGEKIVSQSHPPKPLQKDGTSEGAKLGWETRRGGGGAEQPRQGASVALSDAESVIGLLNEYRPKISGAESDYKMVLEEATERGERKPPKAAERTLSDLSGKVYSLLGQLRSKTSDAVKRGKDFIGANANPKEREDYEFRQQHAMDDVDEMTNVAYTSRAIARRMGESRKSLDKEGTSEGAKLGWEMRRGGAKEEKPKGPPKVFAEEFRQVEDWMDEVEEGVGEARVAYEGHGDEDVDFQIAVESAATSMVNILTDLKKRDFAIPGEKHDDIIGRAEKIRDDAKKGNAAKSQMKELLGIVGKLVDALPKRDPKGWAEAKKREAEGMRSAREEEARWRKKMEERGLRSDPKAKDLEPVDPISKAGTSEGAKLGWETRRGGASAPEGPTTKMPSRQEWDKLQADSDDMFDVSRKAVKAVEQIEGNAREEADERRRFTTHPFGLKEPTTPKGVEQALNKLADAAPKAADLAARLKGVVGVDEGKRKVAEDKMRGWKNGVDREDMQDFDDTVQDISSLVDSARADHDPEYTDGPEEPTHAAVGLGKALFPFWAKQGSRVGAPSEVKEIRREYIMDALSKEGTSDGAVKGWETRKGGAAGEPEKPKAEKPLSSGKMKDLLSEKKVYADKISGKDGKYKAYFGFFYRPKGESSQTKADKIQAALPEAKIINHKENNVAFRGGAPVERQTHFMVEFEYTPKTEKPPAEEKPKVE